MSRQLREETRQQRETMRRVSESEREPTAAERGPHELDPAVRRAIHDEVRIALEELRRDPDHGRDGSAAS
jgi:uncharacterized membrane-anchored protein YjiN (DUF445 family)